MHKETVPTPYSSPDIEKNTLVHMLLRKRYLSMPPPEGCIVRVNFHSELSFSFPTSQRDFRTTCDLLASDLLLFGFSPFSSVSLDLYWEKPTAINGIRPRLRYCETPTDWGADFAWKEIFADVTSRKPVYWHSDSSSYPARRERVVVVRPDDGKTRDGVVQNFFDRLNGFSPDELPRLTGAVLKHSLTFSPDGDYVRQPVPSEIIYVDTEPFFRVDCQWVHQVNFPNNPPLSDANLLLLSPHEAFFMLLSSYRGRGQTYANIELETNDPSRYAFGASLASRIAEHTHHIPPLFQFSRRKGDTFSSYVGI